jgi:putative oxidoreductase
MIRSVPCLRHLRPFPSVQPEDEYAPAKRWRDNDNTAVQTLVKLALDDATGSGVSRAALPIPGPVTRANPSSAGPQLLHRRQDARRAEALLPEAPGAAIARGLIRPMPLAVLQYRRQRGDPRCPPRPQRPVTGQQKRSKNRKFRKDTSRAAWLLRSVPENYLSWREPLVHPSTRPTMNTTRYFPLGGRLFIDRPFVASSLSEPAACGATVALIVSSNFPMPPPLAYAGAVTIELVLSLYRLPKDVFFHTSHAGHNQALLFIKNVILTGGLLHIALGAGAICVDNRHSKDRGLSGRGGARRLVPKRPLERRQGVL